MIIDPINETLLVCLQLYKHTFCADDIVQNGKKFRKWPNELPAYQVEEFL